VGAGLIPGRPGKYVGSSSWWGLYEKSALRIYYSGELAPVFPNAAPRTGTILKKLPGLSPQEVPILRHSRKLVNASWIQPNYLPGSFTLSGFQTHHFLQARFLGRHRIAIPERLPPSARNKGHGSVPVGAPSAKTWQTRAFLCNVRHRKSASN